MIVTPEFPEHRLQDPTRQAEWRVYQEIAGSQAPGRALYEMRAGLYVPQLDFGIWLQDVAYYGLQCEGAAKPAPKAGSGASTAPTGRRHSLSHRPDLRCGDRHPGHHQGTVAPEGLHIPGPLLPRHGPGPDHRGPGCRGPRHCPLGRRRPDRPPEGAGEDPDHPPPADGGAHCPGSRAHQPGMGHPAGAPGPASAPGAPDAVVELPGGRLVVHVHVHLPRDPLTLG